MPEMIDAAAFGDRHQPCARVARNALARPLFERGDERVLREIFSEPDVARHARQRGDELRRFDFPDGVNRACGIPRFHGSNVPSFQSCSSTVERWDLGTQELLLSE